MTGNLDHGGNSMARPEWYERNADRYRQLRVEGMKRTRRRRRLIRELIRTQYATESEVMPNGETER